LNICIFAKISGNFRTLQNAVNKSGKRFGLKINAPKTIGLTKQEVRRTKITLYNKNYNKLQDMESNK